MICVFLSLVSLLDNTCIWCKNPMEYVIATSPREVRPYESYQFWGESIGPSFELFLQAKVFIPINVLPAIQQLFQWRCRYPGCFGTFPDERKFRQHLKSHQLLLCDVCATQRKVQS